MTLTEFLLARFDDDEAGRGPAWRTQIQRRSGLSSDARIEQTRIDRRWLLAGVFDERTQRRMAIGRYADHPDYDVAWRI